MLLAVCSVTSILAWYCHFNLKTGLMILLYLSCHRADRVPSFIGQCLSSVKCIIIMKFKDCNTKTTFNNFISDNEHFDTLTSNSYHCTSIAINHIWMNYTFY